MAYLKASGLLLICVFVLGAPVLLAQNQETGTPVATNVQDPPEENMFSLLFKGGWVMIPIALASVLALTLSIERFISLRKKRIAPPSFLPGLKAVFKGDSPDIEKGKEYCDSNKCVISDLIKSSLPKTPKGEQKLQHALEDAGAREVDKMKRSIKPLSMIATIAPLLGLLGTVYGMIGAFQASTAAGTGKSDVLAQGIYEALVTTASGLTLAIPVLIIYLMLNNRIDGMVDVLDENAEEFMEFALNGKAS